MPLRYCEEIVKEKMPMSYCQNKLTLLWKLKEVFSIFCTWYRCSECKIQQRAFSCLFCMKMLFQTLDAALRSWQKCKGDEL